MEPFLSQVARHYYTTVPVSKYVFVFPNRRSLSFFRHYLSQMVKDMSLNIDSPSNSGHARPLVVPAMYTYGDFMYAAAGASPSDRITLLLKLFECYREVGGAGNNDSLDEFIFWGDVILKDFDDVDKSLVDPKALFTNVTEFRDMEDTTYSYMTPQQIEAVKTFVRHFKQNGQMKVEPGEEGVKGSFLQIWQILHPLYLKFRESLMEEGVFYSGMIFRDLAERVSPKDTSSESIVDILGTAFPSAKKFVFVGLNDIDKCGRTVLKKMQSAGIAEFCWDYCSWMIKDGGNKSSRFMKDNLSDFRPAFEAKGGDADPEINVVAVPSGIGQTKYIPEIFRRISPDISSVGSLTGGKDCAIVLPDDKLLMPLLNTIPEEIKDINVTMGVPMSSSAIYSLMKDIVGLQFHMRNGKEGKMFYHRQVWNILKSPVMTAVIAYDSENGDESILDRIRRIKDEKRYYIPSSWFSGSPLLEAIFRPVVEDITVADDSQIRALEEYILSAVMYIAPRLPENLSTEKEYCRRFWACVMRLREKSLPIRPTTFSSLLERLLEGESVAFEGEPLKGLQIMGPLETRALDFSNLIILSCNEGVFPGRGASPSFIPPALRVGFSLPTYEDEDAVWAYNFYRMIQRPKKVWLLYDTRTEKMLPGEESRFIKQLSYHFRVNIHKYVAEENLLSTQLEDSVPKPPDIAERMKEIKLSATSVENYLYCQAKFYYSVVEKIKAEEDVAETLDSGMLGNVFHATMQALYLGGIATDPAFEMDERNINAHKQDGSLVPLEEITVEYLDSWMKRKDDIRKKVRSLIETELHIPEISGRDLVVEDIIVKYVLQTLKVDKEELSRRGLRSFRIIDLEKRCEWKFMGHTFKGFIDRIDAFGDVVRVVDYKTGKVTDLDVDSSDPEKVVKQLFGDNNLTRPKIAFQLFLYDMFMENLRLATEENLHNAIYGTGKMFSSQPETVKVNPKLISAIKDEKLPQVLTEMNDPSIPYKRVKDEKNCKWCDFRIICGRNPKSDDRDD